MPILSGIIDGDGALVDVQFGWSATAVKRLRARMSPIPQPVSARALLDTGAEVTCLDTSRVRILKVPVRGPTLANIPAAGGLTLRPQHDTALTIVHPSGNAGDHLLISDLLIMEVPLAALGFQALLGRDVLARCRFIFNGPVDRFELAY